MEDGGGHTGGAHVRARLPHVGEDAEILGRIQHVPVDTPSHPQPVVKYRASELSPERNTSEYVWEVKLLKRIARIGDLTLEKGSNYS